MYVWQTQISKEFEKAFYCEYLCDYSWQDLSQEPTKKILYNRWFTNQKMLSYSMVTAKKTQALSLSAETLKLYNKKWGENEKGKTKNE